jgi:hypothetical protein
MKKTIVNYMMTTVMLPLLAVSAYAGATSAAGALHVTVPPPPPPPPPPSVNAGAAAQTATTATAATSAASGSVSGAAQTTAATAGAASDTAAAAQTGAAATTDAAGAASGSAAGSVQPAAAVSTSTGTVSAGTATHASADGQAAGVANATQLSGDAATSLDVDGVVHAIGDSSYEAREAVATQAKGKLDASEKLMVEFKAKAQKEDDRARADFEKAQIEVRARATQLRADLKEATRSADASAWGDIRSGLVVDYRAYAKAFAAASASVNASR